MILLYSSSDPRKGPWRIVPHPMVYEGILRYSRMASLRRDTWIKMVSMAGSDMMERRSSNVHAIHGIVQNRSVSLYTYMYPVINTLCLLIHCLILFPDLGYVDTRIHV